MAKYVEYFKCFKRFGFNKSIDFFPLKVSLGKERSQGQALHFNFFVKEHKKDSCVNP